jgi:hypothetical protein
VDDERFGDPAATPTGLRMEYDEREPGPTQSVVVVSPTTDDVAAALRSLDQSRRTEVTLEDATGAYITVGGGLGVYHVYIGAVDHEDRVILQRPGPPGDGPTALVMDGQRQHYAAQDVVDQDTALAALAEFMESGRPHPDLSWRAG